MTYTYIDKPEALARLAREFRSAPLLAVDTEAAGYHRYRDQLSLVQISVGRGNERGADLAADHNFLVDPFAVEDLSPLASLLGDSGIETVLHDADYDLRILDRDAGVGVRGLFDTQVAAAFLGDRALGLSAVVEKYLSVHLPKGFQRADWAQRPLSDAMKEYAATDTAYLPGLRDRLCAELLECGRLEWAREEFQRREGIRWEPSDNSDEAFLRLKGARDLPPRGLAVLRELHGWREEIAERRDRAPFRVLGNQALLALSVRPPRSAAALSSVAGLSGQLIQRRGREILGAVERGLAVPEADLPRYPPPKRWNRDPEAEARADRLRTARNRRAEALDLDPGFLMPRAQLAEVARRVPTTADELAALEDVRQWQVEAVGDALLDTLRRG